MSTVFYPEINYTTTTTTTYFEMLWMAVFIQRTKTLSDEDFVWKNTLWQYKRWDKETDEDFVLDENFDWLRLYKWQYFLGEFSRQNFAN